MRTIYGYHLPALSSTALYIQGVVVIVAIWHEPVYAYLTGTKLKGDVSLPSLFNKYISSVVFAAGVYFKTAHSGTTRDLRLVYRGQLLSCIVVLTIAYWDILTRKIDREIDPKNESLKTFAVWMLLGGVLTAWVVEMEAKWEEKEIEELKELVARLRLEKEELLKKVEIRNGGAERVLSDDR